MSKTTAAQRQDSSVTGDAIWRTTINDELRSTRQWNHNFEYLIPENQKVDIDKIIQDERIQQELEATKKREIKPFYSELSMLPDEPNRRDQQTRDKFMFRQNRDRVLPVSEKRKYLEQKLPIPPNLLNPFAQNVSNSNDTSKNNSTSEINTILSKFNKNNEKRVDIKREHIDRESKQEIKNLETQTETKENKRRPKLGLEYKELDKRFPQQKLQAPLTSSQEIGWDPRSLEIFGVAKHGLKKKF